jgi:hypothetical protein
MVRALLLLLFWMYIADRDCNYSVPVGRSSLLYELEKPIGH